MAVEFTDADKPLVELSSQPTLDEILRSVRSLEDALRMHKHTGSDLTHRITPSLHFITPSAAFSVASGNTTYVAPGLANFAVVSWAVDAVPKGGGAFLIAKAGATTLSVQYDAPAASDAWKYTFAWGVTGITVTENTDEDTTHTVAGTFYWYQ